jgi:hypothetical protein
MNKPATLIFSGAVEGPVDEAILRAVLEHVGLRTGDIYGKQGKPDLRKKIRGYNQAARHSPWVILVDLDHDAECAPNLLRSWLPHPSPYMNFRVAVRKIEAWLLADRDRVANFLGISVSKVPGNPDGLDDPKQTMISLASRSRRGHIRQDMVPRPESGRQVGPAYPSRLIEFVNDPLRSWRPDVAAENSDSLRRFLLSLHRVLKQ